MQVTRLVARWELLLQLLSFNLMLRCQKFSKSHSLSYDTSNDMTSFKKNGVCHLDMSENLSSSNVQNNESLFPLFFLYVTSYCIGLLKWSAIKIESCIHNETYSKNLPQQQLVNVAWRQGVQMLGLKEYYI